MTQPFPTLDSLVRSLHLILPTPRETWRLVLDPVYGTIHGIANVRGAAIATNGIIVLLLNEVGVVHFGHLQWFVADASEKDAGLSDLYNEPAAVPPRKVRGVRMEEDYVF